MSPFQASYAVDASKVNDWGIVWKMLYISVSDAVNTCSVNDQIASGHRIPHFRHIVNVDWIRIMSQTVTRKEPRKKQFNADKIMEHCKMPPYDVQTPLSISIIIALGIYRLYLNHFLRNGCEGLWVKET